MTADAPAIDSRAEFVAAVKWGFETAAAHGARRIVCCDPGFVDWPLDDAGLLEGLAAWLRLPQRRLVLLARNYDEMPRRWPRFVALRRDWAHAIEAWQPPADLATELPTVLVADRAVTVVLADAVHWRGRAALDAREAQSWREQIDAVLQRSEPGFAVYTLGL